MANAVTDLGRARTSGSRRGWERPGNRVIEADVGISLTRLRPEGGIRRHRLALYRFPEWTVKLQLARRGFRRRDHRRS